MAENKWIEWAKELQNLSQCALAYCTDPYDIERFQRIRDISAEMAAEIGDLPLDQVKATFCAGDGYQTPKLDTRAVVIKGGKILLVQESDGQWALPGGWVDYDNTIRSNAAKEVLEEAGMVVEPVRVIALFDHNRRNHTNYHSNICSAYVLCEYRSGAFQPNPETIASGFFDRDSIPEPLAAAKTTREQIELCFRAAEGRRETTRQTMSRATTPIMSSPLLPSARKRWQSSLISMSRAWNLWTRKSSRRESTISQCSPARSSSRSRAASLWSSETLCSS